VGIVGRSICPKDIVKTMNLSVAKGLVRIIYAGLVRI